MWTMLVCAVALAADVAGTPPLKTLEDIRIRDPFVLPVPETGWYYLYGTGKPLGETGFDAYRSRDLRQWEGPFAVFRPPAGFWGVKDFWAPEVHRYRGKYYMFATFLPKEPEQRGTGILVADTPEGPFVPHSDGPATPREVRALDGTLFVDPEGKPWMVFCHEWEQIVDGSICAMRLSEDLKRAEGAPVTLFQASQAAWVVQMGFGGRQGKITDGPWVWREPDGSLVTLWSSFGAGKQYMTSTARSASGSITGPWVPSPEPFLTEDGGHGMFFETFDGKRLLSLHQPNRHPDERAKFYTFEAADGTVRVTGPWDIP